MDGVTLTSVGTGKGAKGRDPDRGRPEGGGGASPRPVQRPVDALARHTTTLLFVLALIALLGAIGLYAVGRDGAGGVVLSVCTGVVGTLGGGKQVTKSPKGSVPGHVRVPIRGQRKSPPR